MNQVGALTVCLATALLLLSSQISIQAFAQFRERLRPQRNVITGELANGLTGTGTSFSSYGSSYGPQTDYFDYYGNSQQNTLNNPYNFDGSGYDNYNSNSNSPYGGAAGGIYNNYDKGRGHGYGLSRGTGLPSYGGYGRQSWAGFGGGRNYGARPAYGTKY